MSKDRILPLRATPSDHLFHLEAMNSADARRLWRRAIKSAWNDHCAYCNHTPIDDNSLTIDHVQPRSKGGKDSTSNCIPACHRCNQAKGSEEWISWYRRQEFYITWYEIEIRHWLSTGVCLRTLSVDKHAHGQDNFRQIQEPPELSDAFLV